MQRCQRFASDHPFRFARVVAGGMGAMLALLDGRLADARAALDQAERDSGGAASLGLAAQISTQRFWLALEEGRLEGLPRALERAFDRYPGLPALTSGLGLVHALSGDRESAQRALADVLAVAPTMPYDRGRLPCLVIAAEVAYRVRSREAASILELELRPYAELGSVVATASIFTGSVSHGLGWLAALRGDLAAAKEHFAAALRMHERRSPVWQERTRAALAEIARPSRSPSSPELRALLHLLPVGQELLQAAVGERVLASSLAAPRAAWWRCRRRSWPPRPRAAGCGRGREDLRRDVVVVEDLPMLRESHPCPSCRHVVEPADERRDVSSRRPSPR